MLSTHHHTSEIDYDGISNKPEIINFYNRTKGAVDANNQALEANTVRRKTRRWPNNVFYFMIDEASHNSCALTLIKMENDCERVIDKERFKQRELEKIVISLITPNAKDRYYKFKEKRFKNVSRQILDQIVKIPNVIF